MTNDREETQSGWRSVTRGLRHPNYRLFFGGQSLSLIGTWMTRIATAWLVYRLTHSAFLLGLVSFASQAPVFFLAPFAGVWVDRWNRHRTLVVTQVLSMLQSFALAWLALRGTITVADILWLSLAQGMINAFDMPARQSFVVEMIEDRADLGNAIALNSSMVHVARLLGPSIAGVVIAAVGEGYCFLADGVSYIAVIVSLLAMRLRHTPPRKQPASAIQQLREGWSYVLGHVPIRCILLLLAVVSLVAMPYTTLMPIFAGGVLQGGPHTLGFLMGASGGGALVAATLLASRREVDGLGRVVGVAAAVLGAALIAFGLSRSLALSLLIIPIIGGALMNATAGSNTILQTIVEEDKRGRVMSFYSMAFMGMTPFGSLLAGALAARIGAPKTLMIAGGVCLVGAGWFWRSLPSIGTELRLPDATDTQHGLWRRF